MKNYLQHSSACLALLAAGVLITPQSGRAADPITHQISLGSGQTWCSDAMIYELFDQINLFRTQNGVPALKMDTLGMKDAEMRAVQFIAYMETHDQGTPGFNPHEGYDTTAASLGYNIISENLSYQADPVNIVWGGWQDSLHRAAMLTTSANVAGVACVYSAMGLPYWTYEPGWCSGTSCGTSPPSPGPSPDPSGTPSLDSEESAFLTLINNYRAQNGAGPLQVSATLESSSKWMSNDMAAKNYVSHGDSLGRSAGARLAAFGYTYSPWGENIAAGFSDAQSALNGWINACDPDASGNCTYAHRSNMLNKSFVAIGIGRAYGASSGYGWYWTTDFGGYLDKPIGPNPNPTPAPTIGSFTATPSTITAGQSATLSWSVSGAAALTIDNGVGTVTNTSSRTVSPSQTTTYRLTASNASGSATAVVTVTVNSPSGGDTVPPGTPTLTATVKSSMQVDLSWTASTDNTGVAGYQILRNGSVLASVAASALSYSDVNVAANTSYSYNVKAYDAAHNYSNASNTAQVVTPAPPSPGGGCPAPAGNAFTGCYYNNTTMSGAPVLIRTDAQVNFDWFYKGPDPSVTPDNFSVRWQGNFQFDQGSYTFTAVASDGIRVYIDGNAVIDQWVDQSPNWMFRTTQTLSQGAHLVTVEYYERTGWPTAHVTWKGSGTGPSPAPSIAAFTATPASIAPGGSSQLAWSVSGATAVSIDNGIGSVTGTTSRTVSPSQTTTYRLTASNANGTATATATVTVTPAGDTQPPSAPSLTATAKSATEVDLTWTASMDNMGVAGYQITRNGSVLATVNSSARSYGDTKVSADTSYTYSVKAYDAANNYSAASNGVQVRTPASGGSAGPCPAPAQGAFTGCYYNNLTLSGTPAVSRTDTLINFDWGGSSPDPAVTAGGFSARWQGYFDFEGGQYLFTAMTSDGMRIYIDGRPILDRWMDQPIYMYNLRPALTQGTHLITVEYYERTGQGTAHLTWKKY
jgi:uncharacterized protein YkwD/chitodextrinase